MKKRDGKGWDAVTITKAEFTALQAGDVLWYRHSEKWKSDGVVWRKVKVIYNWSQSSTLRYLRLEDAATKEIYTVSEGEAHLLSLRKVNY